MHHPTADTQPRLQLRSGDIVAGKFRIERVIGEGGMGIVFAATHLLLREPVALKFLRPELLVHPELVARFAFEARAAAKVKSEHVARVLDVGDLEGVPFMVLEHLEGRNLGNRVADSGPLSLREASEVVIHVCEALAEAHALGIVHRDVKPENLFLVERAGYRLVKLIDFGISQAPEPVPPSARGSSRSAATADEMALLETGEVMGSPSYMSPEQLTKGRLDARTDIWSLGAVLYELLTGVPMFDPNKPLQEIMTAVLEAPIPSVLDVRPELPLAVAGVLSRCLARDPELRFQSAAELAVALLPFAPRRARESAERAVSQVRSSGGSEPRLPSSEAPIRNSSEPRIVIDPMLYAIDPTDDEERLRSALKPAPVPFLPSFSAAANAPTVRIERVPTALDSSPATSRSVEPPADAAPLPRARSPFVAAVAAAAIVLLGAFAGHQARKLSTWMDAPAAAGSVERNDALPPSAFSILDAFAEPSREVLVLDASVVRPRASAGRACENPYGCDDTR